MRAIDRARSLPSRHRGLTYLAVLLFLAITGAALAATGLIWSHEAKRANERELLWIGMEFRDAIALYYARSPGSVPRYPPSLDELLEDRRYLSLQRYLRRIYRDPLTREARWGTVAAPGGGVMGVYSLAPGRPIKTTGFPVGLTHFEGTTSYAGWQFVFVPAVRPGAVAPGASGGARSPTR